MEYFTFGAEQEDVGTRIDVFLADAMENLSRSGVQKLIEEGHITLNGGRTKANYKLRERDIIDVEVPEVKEVEILPEDIPLDILYEDADVIVVNKPQGMVVHPAPGHTSGTLVNALMVAKNDMAHQSLAAQLAEHSITRKYNAVVYNGFTEDEGTVDEPIGRNPQDRKKMAVTQKHSRHAVTHYRVIERMEKFTLIEAQLETGRTHQIRVHMTYIGHPLLGDLVYGPKKQPIHLEGQALHARVLGFIHPRTGEYLEFEAPLPPYFEALLERLRK